MRMFAICFCFPVLVAFACGGLKSVPDQLPKPSEVGALLDRLDDALSVAELAHEMAVANEPAVCAEPSDACDHLREVLARTTPALTLARTELSRAREDAAHALKAAEAVQLAVREVRALAR